MEDSCFILEGLVTSMEKDDLKHVNSQKKGKVIYILLLVLLSKYYLPAEIFFVVIFFYFLFMIIQNRFKVLTVSNNHILYLIAIISLGILSGIINLENYPIRSFYRDIFYYINPILIMLIGIYIAKFYRNSIDIFKTIILLSFILSFLSLLSLLKIEEISTISIRSSFRLVDVTVVIGLTLLLTERKLNLHYFNLKIKKAFILIMTVAIVGSLSRTNYISFLIMGIILLIDVNNPSVFIRNILKIVPVFIILFVCIYMILPDVLAIDLTNKFFRSLIEISINNNWTTQENVILNWRGFENYSAIQMYSQGNIFENVFGFGFGSEIYVGEFASIVDESATNSIPVLHNGYYTILIKTGIIGLLLFISFLIINLYKTSINIKKGIFTYENKVVIGILLLIIVLTFVITGMFSKGSLLIPCLILGYIPNLRDSRL